MMRTCRIGIATIVSSALFVPSREAVADTTSTLYHHATVFTGRAEQPDATWFVVENGRVADVGSGDTPARWRGAHRVDLGGRFVMPGFVDAHVHFVEGGLRLIQEDLADVASPDDVKRAIARAARNSVSDFVVVRNMGLGVIGNQPPTHERMAPITAAAGAAPILVTLNGGHQVYANRAALGRLGIDAHTPAPPGGTIAKDGAGKPTGLLVDAAAWNALQTVESALSPAEIARAIDAASRRAQKYGITSIGDNTLFPAHLAQYVRMVHAGVLSLRVTARSYGPEPSTRLAMNSQGASQFGGPDPRIHYFGENFFLDGALGPRGSHGGTRHDAVLSYSSAELRDQMLFAAPFGTAYHTWSREGTERLVQARSGIEERRRGSLPDVIDHCERCGGGGLPERIRKAGFRITVLPGQLHDLPALSRDEAPDDSLLSLRELFDAGLEPALTSDWPFGAETTYPGIPDGLNRIGLAPLANVAVVTSGKTPDGRNIAGAETRTISMGRALLGVTAYGAAAIGRSDVGRIAPGAWADFVVLPVSPFQVDPVSLYGVDPVETFSEGVVVASTSSTGADRSSFDVSPFASHPSGFAISPIIGYDPVPGFLLGAAYFFYPYEASGPLGSVQAFGSPAQLRGRVEAELIVMRAFGRVSPRIAVRFDTLRDRYYGVGMRTVPDVYQTTEPVRVDASAGVLVALNRSIQVGIHAVGGYLREKSADAIQVLAGGDEGAIEGGFAGGRVELAFDDRDNVFGTRFGGRRILWTETYGLQASKASFRQRFGATITQFIPLRAPDFVLALRAEAGSSVGTHAYTTDFALGGSDLLRGYYSNRFRGHHYAAGTIEIRAPIVGPFSAVAFGDVGTMWVDSLGAPGALGRSGGLGLRFGLPPDRLVRLRFDFGFAPDQWGVFFKFNEAF
jgi:predicted amidohydrolase YtcJ